jgi:hypothetical protein
MRSAKGEKTIMYEVPALSQVGKAAEVIRGVASIGNDVDGLLFIPDWEFQNDAYNE